MVDELKKKISEFVKIADSCPENLREKCFEILLTNYLNSIPLFRPESEMPQKGGIKEEKGEIHESPKQQDIIEKDLHVKVLRFLKKYTLSVRELNQIFYKEGQDFLPLYEDLKTTKASESQIRIALLQALKNSLINGNFEFNVEQVRGECTLRKCYDSPNFTSILKKSVNLFDKLDKTKKLPTEIKLSEAGREELANLIKALQ